MSNFELFNSVDQPIFIINKDKDIIFINDRLRMAADVQDGVDPQKCHEIFKDCPGDCDCCPVDQILHSPTKQEQHFVTVHTRYGDSVDYEMKLSLFKEGKLISAYIITLYDQTKPTHSHMQNLRQDVMDDILQHADIRDIFNIDELNEFVKSFAYSVGVTSAIFDNKNELVTGVHNFFDSCRMVRESQEGMKLCLESDAKLIESATDKAVVRKCSAAGLMDGSAPIIVNGRRLGAWAFGEVLIKDDFDENEKREFARKIGINEDEYIEKLKEHSVMTMETMEKIAHMLQLITTIMGKTGVAHLAAKRVSEKLEEEVEKEAAKRQKQEQMLFEQRRFVDMGQLMNAIAHQWRQPLNNIYLFGQLMKDIHEGEEGDYDEYFNQQETMIEYMSKTIDDFRNFFISSKKKRVYNVVDVLLETLQLMKSQIMSCGINVRMTCHGKKELLSCIDSMNVQKCDCVNTDTYGADGELKQVFLNIISNAKDAILEHEGLSKEERIIDINVKGSSSYINVTISNYAGNIPENILNRIFDPYFTTKDEGKGTGIGLYMSKMIIEDSMNGNLACKNIENGVCFTISVPANTIS